MTPLQNALRCVEELGWPVFPAVGKMPAIPGKGGDSWKGQATTNPAEIKRLFRKAANADGYGIVPPAGYVILDYDPYTPAKGSKVAKGSPAADRFYKRNIKPETQDCPRISTPSGGIHTLFRDKAVDMEGSKFLIPGMKGLDCKGHGIGYVIGPNGKDRKWLHRGKLRPMNWLLLELVKALRPKPVVSDHKGNYSKISKQQLIDLLSHVTPDCEMNQWVGIFMGIASNFPDNPDLAIDIADEWSQTGFLKNYTCPRYDINANGHRQPGITRQDIERKIRNPKSGGNVTSVGTIVKLARDSGYSGPIGERLTFKEALALQEAEEDEPEEEGEAEPKQKTKSTRHILSIDDVNEQYFPDYLVDKLIPKGGIGFLVARQNSGKTAFIAELATCIQGGLEFFGRECEQGKVLILEKDDWRGLHRFLYGAMLKHGLRKLAVSRHQPKSIFDTTGWTDEEMQKAIDEVADQWKEYSIIIFETVTSMFSAAKMDEAWAKVVSNFLGELSKRLPTTTLLAVSHSARGNDVNTFGSSLLTHNADFEIKMDRKEIDQPIKVYTGKAREFHMPPLYLKFMSVEHRRLPRSVGYLDIDPEGEGRYAASQAREGRKEEFYQEKLDMLKPFDGQIISRKDLNKIYDKPADDQNFGRKVKWEMRLIEEGILKRKDNGKTAMYQIDMPFDP